MKEWRGGAGAEGGVHMKEKRHSLDAKKREFHAKALSLRQDCSDVNRCQRASCMHYGLQPPPMSYGPAV